MKGCVAVLSRIKNLTNELHIALPKVNFVEISKNDIDNEQLYKSEIIIADFDFLIPHFNKLNNTKWIQGTWAGVDKIVPYKNHINKELIISRYSGVHFGRLMSEYVVTNIVNFERGLFDVYQNKLNKTWSRKGKILNHRAIYDLKIGILGVGTIGDHIAKILSSFGAKIWGLGRRENIPDTDEYKHYEKYCATKDLPLLLKNCDYIVNVLPNTEETSGLLNCDVLSNCEGKNTVFINIGRGTIISENDLITALKNKWLATAILDVFNTEPLPVTSELWDMNEVFITPHVAGVSRAKDIAQQFAMNLDCFLTGKAISTQFSTENKY